MRSIHIVSEKSALFNQQVNSALKSLSTAPHYIVSINYSATVIEFSCLIIYR
jgi:hypothetical protein